MTEPLNLCIIDNKGEVLSYGKTLNHILYKPGAFENMARRGRFTIPSDKDGNFSEDLEYMEIPEPLDFEFDEETGKIKKTRWSKHKFSEVKKVIADKMEKIYFLEGENERLENTLIKLKGMFDTQKRGLNVADEDAQINQSELSKNIGRFLEGEKRVGEMHMQITKLTELKAVYENILDKKDFIINKVLEKLELSGEPKSDLLKEQIKTDLEFYKAILPEKVEVRQEVPQEIRVPIQPGEVIRR